jgi:hypothetical protein
LLGWLRGAAAAGVEGASKATARRGEIIVELVIGLVTYAIIWTVVIFGSEFVNKNVQ